MSEPLRRVFSVLDLIAASARGATASLISQNLDLPLPTAFRQLQRLTELGLVRGAGRNGAYVVGPRLRRLAQRILSRRTVEEVAAPVLQRLADELGAAAYIAGLFDLEVLSMCVQLPQASNAPFVHPGRQFKAHASAGGKVLLAYQDRAFLREFASRTLARFTEQTITRHDVLDEQLTLIREAGFAVANGESDPNLWGLACPVRDRDGAVPYGVGFIAFRSLVIDKPDYVSEVLPHVTRSAAELSAALIAADQA